MIIGIFAGIGSGKSTVLDILKEEYSAYVMEADKIAHSLYKKGEAVYYELIKLCVSNILDEDGEIDRKLLAEILYKDDVLLQRVNELVHHKVWSYMYEQAVKYRELYPYIVIEAAIMPASRDIFDEIWYIESDEAVRRERLKKSRGYTDEKISAIISKQADEAAYKSFADRIIDNNSDIEELRIKIRDILKD